MLSCVCDLPIFYCCITFHCRNILQPINLFIHPAADKNLFPSECYHRPHCRELSSPWLLRHMSLRISGGLARSEGWALTALQGSRFPPVRYRHPLLQPREQAQRS